MYSRFVFQCEYFHNIRLQLKRVFNCLRNKGEGYIALNISSIATLKGTIRNQRRFRRLKKGFVQCTELQKGFVHRTELQKGSEKWNKIETFLKVSQVSTKPSKKFPRLLTSLLEGVVDSYETSKRFRICSKKSFVSYLFFQCGQRGSTFFYFLLLSFHFLLSFFDLFLHGRVQETLLSLLQHEKHKRKPFNFPFLPFFERKVERQKTFLSKKKGKFLLSFPFLSESKKKVKVPPLACSGLRFRLTREPPLVIIADGAHTSTISEKPRDL